jgi:phosphonate degradation associated HDIG domain protein
VTTVDEVTKLYARWGNEHYDEDLGQIDHALQTAWLAAGAGASDAVIVAALLHDIGHLLALRGDAAGPHERTGPDFLAELFPSDVTAPIALHVAAKRYLCAVDSAYAERLSAGSTRSLQRQGGPMTADEARAFESTPGWEHAVALRRWDDAGKVDGVAVPSFSDYEVLLRKMACSAS